MILYLKNTRVLFARTKYTRIICKNKIHAYYLQEQNTRVLFARTKYTRIICKNKIHAYYFQEQNTRVFFFARTKYTRILQEQTELHSSRGLIISLIDFCLAI